MSRVFCSLCATGQQHFTSPPALPYLWQWRLALGHCQRRSLK